MGSATTQSLVASVSALEAATGVDLDTAAELFLAARTLGDTPQLSGALADSASPSGARDQVVADVFGDRLSPVTVSLLSAMVSERWSSAADLVDGIEEIAVRAVAEAASDVDVERELFEVSRTVAAHPDLELALGSRLGDSSKKGALVEALLRGTASSATTLIVSSLAEQSRERRVRQLLSRAIRIVSEQRGRQVATVVTAQPLTDGQAARLTELLQAKYRRTVTLNTVIDPRVVGGLRVQIADDVIDASVAARLADLRHRLAG